MNFTVYYWYELNCEVAYANEKQNQMKHEENYDLLLSTKQWKILPYATFICKDSKNTDRKYDEKFIRQCHYFENDNRPLSSVQTTNEISSILGPCTCKVI